MDEFYIQWHITNLCNLHCKHCYQEVFSSQDDLCWDKLKLIADNLIRTSNNWNKKTHITITGGEPLLKKETFFLLEYLNKKNEINELSLITNGLFLDKKITQLEKFKKLKTIKFSLDGGNEKTNDSIRGIGNFNKVLKSVETSKKMTNLNIVLMFTLMKRNVDEIKDVYKICKRLKLEGLIVERFIPVGQSLAIKEEVLNKKEWKNISRFLLELCGLECQSEEILPYRAFQIKFKQNNQPNLLGASCSAGSDGVCIMPDGTIFPCRRFNLSIGNLLSQPLSEVWQNSKILNKIKSKKILKGKCKICSFKECRGCRALAFSLTGDFLAEDSQCTYHYSV